MLLKILSLPPADMLVLLLWIISTFFAICKFHGAVLYFIEIDCLKSETSKLLQLKWNITVSVRAHTAPDRFFLLLCLRYGEAIMRWKFNFH